ncbi:hypothetical protein Q1M63_04170 (plasmid) [Sinorhizobium meliloti]|nr:hypothetical protein Q1M63_04170 [Sinorhizobium meliloti]
MISIRIFANPTESQLAEITQFFLRQPLRNSDPVKHFDGTGALFTMAFLFMVLDIDHLTFDRPNRITPSARGRVSFGSWCPTVFGHHLEDVMNPNLEPSSRQNI